MSMCKKCEISNIKMMLRFLDIPSMEIMKNDLSSLKAWDNLFKSGWHEEDLIMRAWAHLKWTEREARDCDKPHWVGNAKVFLSSMAKGFLHPFNGDNCMPRNGDLNFDF